MGFGGLSPSIRQTLEEGGSGNLMGGLGRFSPWTVLGLIAVDQVVEEPVIIVGLVIFGKPYSIDHELDLMKAFQAGFDVKCLFFLRFFLFLAVFFCLLFRFSFS